VHAQLQIPHADRRDEIGDLARALQSLQRASAEQKILIDQAPVGIARVDLRGRLASANGALEAMLGHTRAKSVGQPFFDFLHPEDRARDANVYVALAEGRLNRVVLENRYLRADGTILWCSTLIAALRTPEGQVESFISIQEDISERKRQMDHAARIQRELLPQSSLALDGYELAGACLPAQDMSGDFYDWVLRDGRLDLTLADVMGKGMGAALVMAAFRTALRAAGPALGPAERIHLAAGAMALGMAEEGLFVTLFQARLDLVSGIVRYVDAGHGHWAVRRAGGEVVKMSAAAPPLFVLDDEQFKEREVRLEPGDTLLVYSDGLVEREDHILALDDYALEIEEAVDAEDMVRRLTGTVQRGRLADDVTVVVLRRLPAPAVSPRPPRRRGAAARRPGSAPPDGGGGPEVPDREAEAPADRARAAVPPGGRRTAGSPECPAP
jgi:PAS domain S-box-containing protein